MKLSIFSPFHKPHLAFIDDAYQSLLAQTYHNWEWVIVPNNGASIPEHIAADSKVFVYPNSDVGNNIGALKNFACSKCRGDVLIEFDGDDILLPDALYHIAEAFRDPIEFAYSNDAEFRDKTWEPVMFGTGYGWEYRDFEYEGHELKEIVAWEPSAQMMRMIFWAPDHFRAWRREAYWELGGHDKNIPVGDDHDLLCRTYIKYGAAAMKHIDKCLYLYRVHDNNSCRVFNADIQKATMDNYLRYSRQLMIRWADDNNLAKVDIGGRFNGWDNFTTVDLLDADILCDLNGKWALEDNSVGVLRASHILEHLKDPVHSMNEAYRVLAPGGFLLAEVPSTDGRGAFQDPTHVSFWNENSFWYYTRNSHARFIKPQYKGAFQESRIVTYFPDDFFKQNNIPVVQADLIALKAPYTDRPVGRVLIDDNTLYKK